MCRHLAYLGSPVSLQELLFDPAHSLCEQAYAPRMQRHGTINADGFGAGWYVPERDEPVRFRRAQSIWSDASFASLAPTVRSGCVLAAVRSATPGYGADECCAAPFTHRQWLFSHNGAVFDHAVARKALQERAAWVPDALAPVDSALLFGLAVSHWQGGASLGAGLAATVTDVAAVGGGRLTMVATDGVRLAATTWGEPLYARIDAGSAALASEPYDTAPDWAEIPPASVAEIDGVAEPRLTVRPLGSSDTADDE